MTLHLDARQRAMLEEMGIAVWPLIPPEKPVAVAEKRTAAGAPPTAESGRVHEPDRVTVRARAVARPQSKPSPAAAKTELTPLPPGIEAMGWAELEAAVAACRACGLCLGRTQTVFGVGSRRAEWMVLGEAPGQNEDRLGEPFVGQAGKLLDNMLAAIGLSRLADLDESAEAKPAAQGLRGVYIANVVKCRPPGNRNPQPDEMAACEPYLKRQIALLQPKIILAMGRFAAQSLLQSTEPIGRLRGSVHRYQGVPVIVTYHPAYLLRALPEKAKAWQDLCLARATFEKLTT